MQRNSVSFGFSRYETHMGSQKSSVKKKTAKKPQTRFTTLLGSVGATASIWANEGKYPTAAKPILA